MMTFSGRVTTGPYWTVSSRTNTLSGARLLAASTTALSTPPLPFWSRSSMSVGAGRLRACPGEVGPLSSVGLKEPRGPEPAGPLNIVNGQHPTAMLVRKMGCTFWRDRSSGGSVLEKLTSRADQGFMQRDL